MADAEGNAGCKPRTPVLGILLPQKKACKHLTPALLHRAADEGVTLRVLEEGVPLAAQGHFDVLLHKIRSPEWEEEVCAYLDSHPEVTIIDHPKAVQALGNRATMLKLLDDDTWVLKAPAQASPGKGGAGFTCTTPAHQLLAPGCSLAGAEDALAAASLRYPLVLKPCWADGREGAHALALVTSSAGLQGIIERGAQLGLALPALAQPYIEHGGCLFKVYVLGGQCRMVTRASLSLDQDGVASDAGPGHHRSADDGAEQPGQAGDCGTARPCPGLQLMSRVSAYPSSECWGQEDLAPADHGVRIPPPWVWDALAQRLRERLGLHLFNFDVILPREQGNEPGSTSTLLHLIDINYFPGYEKLAGYEELMVHFFKEVLQQRACSN
ncbi:Inositol-tetrakisphosphate 1-kinase 1 [Auxenochlorella protothecoides]|uniref:Inositol-tetrakisphosphate 1-kinase n=1 Tax=Auxenochlorella protothecoides TaxID=3075 RepID=A0A087SKH0_AUXPR|nr:Inositol-tetrakisphosphate 1-kinase 1 [Auxenochlorella protothecoides]KFM26224.1 Inositol-tetrakisphosphate 1-kinase 1 [Auxenochlorella protothecoides]